MESYVYAKDVLPEMEYSVPKPAHSCWSCNQSSVTNAGAVYPGLECALMEEKFHAAGITNGNAQVNADYGSCKFHSALMTQVRPDIDTNEFPEDEDI